ncbi:MAG: hypothetical protein ABL866_05400 [Devosia sp.]
MVACYGKPGGAAACLHAKFAAIDILPGPAPDDPVASDEVTTPDAPDPKVSDVAPVEPVSITGLLAADGVASASTPVASASLTANPGSIILSGVATASLPSATAGLSPGQGSLVATAEIAGLEPLGTTALSAAPGTFSVASDVPQPVSVQAFLNANGRLDVSGWGRVSGPGISDTGTLAMPAGTIAFRFADYSPPPSGLVALSFAPPPPAIDRSITATGLVTVPPPVGRVSLIAPPPVAVVEIAPVPVEVAPPETGLSPNVTLLPPPGTGENSAIVTIGGGQ